MAPTTTAPTSNTVSSAQAPAAASPAALAQPATLSQPGAAKQQTSTVGPDGRRKKKATRRVGYAREEASDTPPIKPADVLTRPASPAVAVTSTVLPVTSIPPQVAVPPAPTATSQARAVPDASASAAAPLAATHTTAALLDIVSVAPQASTADSPHALNCPASHRTRAAQDNKHASPRRHSARAGVSHAQTAAPAQPMTNLQPTAPAFKPAAVHSAAAQPVSTLADLLSVAVPDAARQDSSGAAPLSPHALFQVKSKISILLCLVDVTLIAQCPLKAHVSLCGVPLQQPPYICNMCVHCVIWR